MTTSLALNNTAPGITPSGCDGGLGTITTPVDIQMVVNGAVGSTPAISGSGVGLASITAIYYIGHTGDLNGQTIAAGTWTVPLDLASQSHPLTLDSIFIYRANSSGVAQATIGSSTGLSTALSTGTNGPFSVTGASATFGTNEIVVISFQVHAGFNGTTLGVTPDQTVVAPAASGGGSGGPVPDTYFSRTFLPANHFPADHNFIWWENRQQVLPPSASRVAPNIHPGRYHLPINYFPPDQTYIWWEPPLLFPQMGPKPRIVMPIAVRPDDSLPLPAIFSRIPVLYTPPVPGGVPPPLVVRSDYYQEGIVNKTPLPGQLPQLLHRPLMPQVTRYDVDEPALFKKTPVLTPPPPGTAHPPLMNVVSRGIDNREEAIVWIGKPLPVINPVPVAGGVIRPLVVMFPDGYPTGSPEPFGSRGVCSLPTPLPVTPAGTTGTRILLRRGPYANIPTLQQGEPAWTTDAHQLFVGDGFTDHYVGGLAATPVSSSSAGYPGQYATDGTYLYICISSGNWKRVLLSTF